MSYYENKFHEEERDGITLRYFYTYDDSSGDPWEEDEQIKGCVKRTDDPPEPWERILSSEMCGYRRENLIFDGRQYVEIAIKEGGCSKAQAAEQLEQAFDRCRKWCNNEWHYVGVTVRAYDEDDEDITPRDVIDSIWHIENDDIAYMHEVGNEIADEIMATLPPKLKAAA